MTISLLNIFDSRGLGFVLLEALIEHEVEETGPSLSHTSNAFTDKLQKTKPNCCAEIV